jgi:hypothetical protein
MTLLRPGAIPTVVWGGFGVAQEAVLSVSQGQTAKSTTKFQGGGRVDRMVLTARFANGDIITDSSDATPADNPNPLWYRAALDYLNIFSLKINGKNAIAGRVSALLFSPFVAVPVDFHGLHVSTGTSLEIELKNLHDTADIKATIAFIGFGLNR